MRRVLVGTCFLLIAAGLLAWAGKAEETLQVLTFLCYSATFALIGAIVLAPLVTGFLAETFAGALFAPGGKRAHLPPYSKAEALAKRGQYREAIDTFRQIARDFPDELGPWLHMITIAIKDLDDMDAAFQFYSEARERFKSQDDRRRLLENYKALKSLTNARPRWAQQTTVPDENQTQSQTGESPPAETGPSAPGASTEGTVDKAPPPASGKGRERGGQENGSRKKTIQYRIAPTGISGPPPEGYMKAVEAALPRRPARQDPVSSPPADAKRARIPFRSEEIAARAAAGKQPQTGTPVGNPAASTRTRMKLAVSAEELEARMTAKKKHREEEIARKRSVNPGSTRTRIHIKPQTDPPPHTGQS